MVYDNIFSGRSETPRLRLFCLRSRCSLGFQGARLGVIELKLSCLHIQVLVVKILPLRAPLCLAQVFDPIFYCGIASGAIR